MNINGTIDKTFFNNGVDLHAPKITRQVEIPEEQDDNFYSNFLQKIKNEDFKAPNKLKPRKSSQFCANMLQIPGKTSFKDFIKSPKKSVENISFNHEADVAKTSNLNPRKLKTDTNNASNMLLVIPGMAGHQNLNKNNSSVSGQRRKSHAGHIKLKDLREPFDQQSRNSETSQKDGHKRKSNGSHIKLKDLRDPFDQQSRNSEVSQIDSIIKDTDRNNNKSNVLQIMIPQITRFREFCEETNKLEIQPNIIEIEVMGTKKPLPFRPFIFDSLKIQKLNSINELSTKQQDNDDLLKSMVILNQKKGSKINSEHRKKQKENQIIIINQNEFQRFPSNKRNNKESKRLFCCIPVE